MDFSFIIVNYNSYELLRKCLNSIYHYVDNFKYEIIIVDNASTDNSIAMVEKKFQKIILIKNTENYGYAKAINQGIKISSGKYVVVLNNDIELQSNIFTRLFNIIENDEKIGILGCSLLNPDKSQQASYFRFSSLLGRIAILTSVKKILKRSSTPISRDEIIEVNYIKGALMVVRKSALEAVGLFDENYFLYHEEMDFCYQFKKNNWKVCSDFGTSVIHYGNHVEDAKNEFVFIERNKSLLYFHRKNYGQINALCLIFINLFFFFIKLFFVKVIKKDDKSSSTYKKVIKLNLKYLFKI